MSSSASFPRWLAEAAAAAAAATATAAEANNSDTSWGCSDSARTVVERVVAVTNNSGGSDDYSSSSMEGRFSASSRSPSSSDYVLAYHVPLSDMLTSASSASEACEAATVGGGQLPPPPLPPPEDRHFGTEFQNNWPHAHFTGSIAEEVTPASYTNSSFARELVVKFASDSGANVKAAPQLEKQPQPQPQPQPPPTQQQQQQQPKQSITCGDSCPTRSFPVWREAQHVGRHSGVDAAKSTTVQLTNCSNTNQTVELQQLEQTEQPVSVEPQTVPAAPATAVAKDAANNKTTTATATAATATNSGHHRGNENEDYSKGAESCRESCSTMRAVGLVLYYVTLWAVTVGFTWLLLEISLMATSKGKFPYYMSPHSFCLKSPQIGFAGTNPELGKVTEFSGLPALRDKLLQEGLREIPLTAADGGQQLRDCDSPAAAKVTATDQLMRPCNLTAFVAQAEAKLKAVLQERPAVLVQIRRHLGYLPKSGSVVKIDCTAAAAEGGKADLPLRYYSWTGTAGIAESTESGSVPTAYFPMLTGRHHAPSVLVAVDTSAKSDWLGKKLTIKCRPADGGEQKLERQVILLVKG